MNQNFLHIYTLIISVFLVSCSTMKENSITIVENPYGSIKGGKEISSFSFKNRHGVEMEPTYLNFPKMVILAPEKIQKLGPSGRYFIAQSDVMPYNHV